MKIVETGGFEFRFENALNAFVFDETDRTRPTFHGAPMKAVDIVAEFEAAYFFVELKDYSDQWTHDTPEAAIDSEEGYQLKRFNWLKNYLKYKFRDSYLYRYAENRVDKPIHYICLITFDNALNSRIQKALELELPVGKVSSRWTRALAESCHVVNLERLNRNFPGWSVTRVNTAEG